MPRPANSAPATPAEIAALKKLEAKQRASSRVPARVGGIETRYADGTVGLSLGDDDMMSSVAVRNADGSITMECLPAKQAEKLARKPEGFVGREAATIASVTSAPEGRRWP